MDLNPAPRTEHATIADGGSNPPDLATLIEASRRIVFFGGAGVSTESGIPDFRSAAGLYSRPWGRHLAPEEILSRSFFDADPETFFDFYRTNLVHPDAKPNDAHRALAALEAAGKVSAVVTQNIDGLHQAAGSKTVWELHGSIWRNHCQRCGAAFALADVAEPGSTDARRDERHPGGALASRPARRQTGRLSSVVGAASVPAGGRVIGDDRWIQAQAPGVPRCGCGGIVKPDVVLYEEGLDERVIVGASDALSGADLLIIGGTSLSVYPAAGLIDAFRGAHLVVINRDATFADRRASLTIRAPIGLTLSPWAPGAPDVKEST